MMKLKKYIKRITAFSLAVVMTVVALPNNLVVYAGPDDYPPEILFPIKVLDFRPDNLLFEYNSGITVTNQGIYLDLFTGAENNNGKGLVKNELGPDGVPEYTEDTLNRIAKYVQQRLGKYNNQTIIDRPVYNGEVNYLSVRNYIKKQGSVKIEAEDGIIAGAARINTNKTNFSNQAGVDYISGDGTRDGRGTVTFEYNASEAGNCRLALYYAAGTNRNCRVIVNGNNHDLWNLNSGDWNRTAAPAEMDVWMNAGTNTITVSGRYGEYGPDLDYIEISNSNGEYPLGDYEDSKRYYTEDMDPDTEGVQNTRGWTDMRTCMDYAYFVTSNLFKYNSTLNTQYNDYEQLVFHKVDDSATGKTAYEFMADQRHSSTKLIFNKDKHTVRNVYGSDTGDTTNGDVVKPGGALFIADDAEMSFPLDKKLKGDGGGYHNFHYTLSSESYFVYKAGQGQYFYFSGDDDVYVFLNGKLLVDLGGAHSQIDDSFNLDSLASDPNNDYGLVNGEPVSLKMFYMERHTTGSNFYAKMNFKLATDLLKHVFDYETIPYGYMANLTYGFTAKRELNTDKNFTFTDNFGNVIGVDGFTLGEGVSLLNNTLTVKVKDQDGTLIPEKSTSFVFENPKNPTSATDLATVARLKEYFANVEIGRFETLEISGAQFDTATKSYDDTTFYTEVADDMGVNSKVLTFVPQVKYDAWMNGASTPTNNVLSASNPVKVIVGSIKITTAPDEDLDGDGFIDEVNWKKELADYGKFVVTRTDEMDATTIRYTNDTAYGVNEITLDKLSQGDYTLTVDESVLTGYTVIVNGKSIVTAKDASGQTITTTEKYSTMNRDTKVNAKMLTIPFYPVYDANTKKWSYPEVRFELKAIRDLPSLKDLT